MKKPRVRQTKRDKDWAAFKAVVSANVIGKDEVCFFPQNVDNVDKYKAVAIRNGQRQVQRQKLEEL